MDDLGVVMGGRRGSLVSLQGRLASFAQKIHGGFVYHYFFSIGRELSWSSS